MKDIKALLFDKDGVIVDFHRTWGPAMLSFVKELLPDHPDRHEELLIAAGYDAASGRFKPGSVWAAGNSADTMACFQNIIHHDVIDWSAFIPRLEAHCAKQEQRSVLPLQDLQGLCRALHQDTGYVLGVATNDLTRSARNALAGFGISDYFHTVLGYDSVTRPKPAAEPVEHFCRRTGLAPANVAVIGDNLHDLEMARAAEVGLAIGVLSGTSGNAELSPLADHIIDDIAHLPQLLKHGR